MAHRILVAVRHHLGPSRFGAFSLSYMYDIAIPLEPVPDAMKGDLKKKVVHEFEHPEYYFEFSGNGVGGRATSSSLPGYVCSGGWNHWRIAWLCLMEQGYVFKPFEHGKDPRDTVIEVLTKKNAELQEQLLKEE